MNKEQQEVRDAYMTMQKAMIEKDMDTLNKIVKDDKNMFIWTEKLRQNKSFSKK